jgi:hypothetical protein
MRALFLSNYASYSDPSGGLFEFARFVQRKHNNRDARQHSKDRVRGLQSISVVHFVIEHNQIGLQLFGLANGFFGILRLSADLPVAAEAEQQLEGITHGFAIFCNQDTSRNLRSNVIDWLNHSTDGGADRLTVFHNYDLGHNYEAMGFVGYTTYSKSRT